MDIFDFDSLFKQLVLALGAALILGNGYAIYQNRKGNKPEGETGEFRAVRAWWLLGVGVVIGSWGLASLVA